MAALSSLIRWQQYQPDIGENRSLARPFFVEIAVGLTKPNLQALSDVSEPPLLPPRDESAPAVTPEELEAALQARVDALAAALAPYVRMGTEPLSVDGVAVDTLPKLLKLYTGLAAGPVALLELPSAVRWFNTAGGATQLFFERLSGGFASTTPGNTGRAGSQRAAR